MSAYNIGEVEAQYAKSNEAVLTAKVGFVKGTTAEDALRQKSDPAMRLISVLLSHQKCGELSTFHNCAAVRAIDESAAAALAVAFLF